MAIRKNSLDYEKLSDGDICPVSKEKITVNKNFLNVKHSDEFSCSFFLLGDYILLTVPNGYADLEGMINFVKVRNVFLQEYSLIETPHIEVKDYRNLKGQTPSKSREVFINMLKSEQDRGFLKGFFGFDASFTVKTLFNIGMSLIASTMPVLILSNYKRAIKEAIRAFENPETTKKEQLQAIQKEQISAIKECYPKDTYVDTLAQNINELYTYINSINWGETEASEIKPLLEIDHPFLPLYDALHILKKDFTDILDKKNIVEKNLKKANEHMEEEVAKRTQELAEKNTILETSLSILSHDTKNLFFNISYLIDQELEGPLKIMFKDSYDELYDNVMETTGYIKEQLRIFSLVEILGKIKVTKDRVPLISHPRIDVCYEDKPELFYIETTTLFKNTITNIVENALKYTPDDKKILLQISRLDNSNSRDDISIKIIDHGKGIPDDEKEKIFEKGFRRESTISVEGTGKGLWITRNIIEKAGGSLVVTDNPAGGSIFNIKIPAFKVTDYETALNDLSEWFSIPIKFIKERAENLELLITMNNQNINDIPSFVFVSILNQLRKENREKTQENIQHKLHKLKELNPDGKSVLIVDDSLYVHYYLATYFTEMGYRIIGFEFNGEKGVKAYKKLKPDLTTLDNNMPILCGKDAAELIYKENSKAKIIFITALGDSSLLKSEVDALDDSYFKILAKPIKKEDLKTILQELDI